MGRNLFSNNSISDNYERRIQLEKLTPVGREILEKYKPVRIDSKTITLVKPEHFSLPQAEKVIPVGKTQKDNFGNKISKKKILC